MANRSYLFMLNTATGQYSNLAEYNYCLPLAFYALCSSDVRVEKSQLFETDELIAFSAEFTGGFAQLMTTLDKVKALQLLNQADYLELKQYTEKFFAPYLAKQHFRVWLEMGELFAMDERSFDEQSSELLQELKSYQNIESEILTELEQDSKEQDDNTRSEQVRNALGYEWDTILYYDLSSLKVGSAEQN